MFEKGSWNRRSVFVLALAGAITMGAFSKGSTSQTGPRLVSVEPLSDGLTCDWAPSADQVGQFFFPPLSASPLQESTAKTRSSHSRSLPGFSVGSRRPGPQ
jgi:hypothetical protein